MAQEITLHTQIDVLRFKSYRMRCVRHHVIYLVINPILWKMLLHIYQ